MPSSGEEGSQQSWDGMEAIKEATDMVSSNKILKAAKRKEIGLEHKQRVEKSRERMQSVFHTRRVNVLKLQNQAWSRLDMLQKKKKNIEKQIISKMKDMEHHSSNFATICVALYQSRMADIAEIDTTGNSNVGEVVDDETR